VHNPEEVAASTVWACLQGPGAAVGGHPAGKTAATRAKRGAVLVGITAGSICGPRFNACRNLAAELTRMAG
jgi:hypothetical protein